MHNNRRKEKISYYFYILILVIVIVAIFAVIQIAGGGFFSLKRETSVIYDITKEYMENGVIIYSNGKPLVDESGKIQEGVFNKDSSEYKYLQGLYLFDKGEYKNAVEVLNEALELAPKSGDKGLLSCIYYYLNECSHEENGAGNPEYVAASMDAAIKCYPVANDHKFIWGMGYTVADSKENDAIVNEHLLKIIDEVPGLSLESEVRYLNIVAMLDNIDGNYGKSIRRFYDVRNMLMDVDAQGETLRQKLFANSYIAGFYFEMEDYENAAKLYEENLAIPVEDKALNAKAKYSDYINAGSVYFELNDTKKALEKCDEAEAILPYLDESLALDVKAQILDSRARAAILDGDNQLALSYLDEADSLVESTASRAFYGNQAFIKLTRCKILVSEGKILEARTVLEEMMESGEVSEAGLEDEAYPILLSCLKEQKDIDAFFKYQSEFEDYSKGFHNTVQREYLEFSQYYNETLVLEQNNTRLRGQLLNRTMMNVGFIFAILIIIIGLFKLRKSGMTDSLTGLYNRKVLTRLLKNNNNSSKNRIGVMMIDIDYFKKYNDTFGHIKGDEVLKQVAKTIKNSVRKQDIVIRYGGEEFLIILNLLDNESASSIGNRILENVREKKIPHEASKTEKYITVSIGLCINEDHNASLEEMINVADEALYKSKTQGRNRIHLLSVPEET